MIVLYDKYELSLVSRVFNSRCTVIHTLREHGGANVEIKTFDGEPTQHLFFVYIAAPQEEFRLRYDEFRQTQ